MLAKFSKYKLDQLSPVDQVAASITNYNHQLASEPHIVTLNFDLPSVKLYLTKFKGVNRCIYEYRDGSLKTAFHRFDESLYEGDTVFTGYMIAETNTYMIEDILVYEQSVIKKEPIDKRLNIINTIVNLKYTPDPVLESTMIIVKDYVEYDYLDSFYQKAQEQPYADNINGLRFCPLGNGKQIIINSDTFMPLLSPRSMAIASAYMYEHRHKIITDPKVDTFVFKANTTEKPDVYELHCFTKGKRLKYYDIACIPDIVTSKKVKQMFGNKKEATVTCVFNREFGRWTPSALSNELPYIWDDLGRESKVPL